MFCEKCGTEIPKEQTQCPNCQWMPKQAQQPEANAEAFQLNMPGSAPVQPPKKKGGSKNLLLVGGIVVVLLAVILVAVFSGVFSSPEDQLLKLEKNTLDAISEAAAEGYGAYVDEMKEEQQRLEKGVGSKSTVKLSMNEEFLVSMLSGMIGEDLTGVDLSWVKNVMLQIDANAKGGNIRAELGVGLNDTVLATMDMIMDMAGGSVFAGIPEVSDTYLSVDLEEMGVSLDGYNAAMDLNAKLLEALPSEKDVQKMLNGYLEILLTYVSEVEKTTEEVSVGGETKELTVLSAKVTEQELMQMCIQWLELAKEDQTLKALLVAFVDYTNQMDAQMNGYVSDQTAEELYGEFLAEVEYALEELEAEIGNADPANYVLLDNFLYHNVIVGRRATMYSDDMEDGSVHYMILPVGTGANFEIVWPDGSVTGSLDGKKLTAELNAEGQSVLSVVTEDLELDEDSLKGTLRLIPGQALLDELYYYGITAEADTYVELTFDTDEESGTVGFGLTFGGAELMRLDVSFAQSKYEEATEPANTIAASSDSELTAWVMGFEFDTLIANMKTAGIPEEYVQMVEQLAALLQMQAMY